MLLSLANLKVKNPVILSKTAELLKAKQFKNIGMITNLLYSMAKLHYKHSDDAWIAASIDIIMSEPVIDRVTACRNLLNLQALDYRSDVAIKRFCESLRVFTLSVHITTHNCSRSFSANSCPSLTLNTSAKKKTC